MGKVKSREERNKDYNDFFGLSQEVLATKKQNQGSSITQERDLGYSAQDKIGKSKFDKGFVPGLDFFLEDSPYEAKQLVSDAIDENRAQTQSHGEKWLAGFGRLLPKIGAEFGKGLGYLGGAIPAAINGDITDMTNNWFVEVFQELEDGAKEAMPIYVREEVENGTLGRQLWSPEFYANEGMDGLGFLLSAFATGGAISGISKSLQIGTKAAGFIGKGVKTGQAIDNAIITGAQTFVESAAETKGMVDELTSYWENRKLEDGTYDTGEVDAEGLAITKTEEEIKSLIGNSAVKTLALNSLFLLGPNALQTKYLFGKAEIPSGLLSKLDNASPEIMNVELAKIVPWKRGLSIGTEKGLKSAGAEAFQELSQFAIEDYESKKGKGLTNDGLIKGLAEGFYEGLTTIEGQKSMFLGAVLGIGPAAISAYRDSKKEIANSKGLIELLNTSTKAFKDNITTIYNKNEDGSIKYNGEGRPEINEEKFTEILDSSNEDNILTKMYNAGKIAGDPNLAKRALNDMTLRHLYSYLGVEGGVSMWEKHLDAFSEIMENDYKALGFKSKEDYSSYMKEIGKTAETEYAKVKDRGPAFYGISAKNFNIESLDFKAVEQELEKLTSQIEYQAVRYQVLKSKNNFKIEEINEEIERIKEKDAKQVLEVDESLQDTLKNTRKNREESRILNHIKSALIKDNKILEQNYDKLYDKEEQQKVFNSRVKSKKNQAEDNIESETHSETSDETPTENPKDRTSDEKIIDSFYKNLESKGYNITKGKEDKTDFGKGVITVKDNKGDIYRIFKKFNKNTGTNDYQILNLDSGVTQPFTLNLVKKLGFNDINNILSKEEFAKWAKNKNILKNNKKALDSLEKLIHSNLSKTENNNIRLEKLQKELGTYSKELEEKIKIESTLTVYPIAKEITALESKIELIESEIKQIQDSIIELNHYLNIMNEMKSELLSFIENMQDFNVGIRFRDLKEKYENGELDINIELANEAIELNKEIENQLKDTLYNLTSNLDNLYEKLSNLEDIENILSNTNLNIGLLDRIKKSFPDLNIENEILGNLTKEEAKFLLQDKEIRKELLERVQNEKAELLEAYKFNTNEIKLIKKEFKEAQKEFKKLVNNKKIKLQNHLLIKKYKILKKLNNITEDKIDYNDPQYLKKDDQDEIDISETQRKKANPFSTISAIFKGKYIDGVFIADRYPKNHPKAGQKILNDNYKQNKRWDEALSDIPLDKLDQYKIKFVNNSQLEELGEKAPSDNSNDIYTVLYSRLDNSPYKHNDGLVYAGVAFGDSMFGDNWSSVEVERMPEYIDIFSKEISENNSAIFNGIEYTDKEELKRDITEVVKEKYNEFRKNLVDKLSKGENMESAITDVSTGIAETSDTRNNPKDVLDVDTIIIPDSNTKSKKNNIIVDVQPGRPYIQDKNGQLIRVYNNKIKDLDKSAKKKILDTIIKFISLSKYVENGNFTQQFAFSGKNTKEKIPLVGSEQKGGILDHFINWGIHKDKPVGIAIFKKDPKDASKGYEVRFKFDNDSDKIDIDNLFDKNGKVKDSSDSSLINLVAFLENKYLNINVPLLNKTNDSIKIPKDYNSSDKTISYDKVSSMQDYFLDNNYLYTHIKKYDNELDEIPQFVNKYITYEKNIVPELPKVEIAEDVIVTPESKSGQTNLLAKESKTSQSDSKKNTQSFEEYEAETMSSFGKLLAEKELEDSKTETKVKEKPKEDKTDCPVKSSGWSKNNRNAQRKSNRK